jgi:hypothetical protein
MASDNETRSTNTRKAKIMAGPFSSGADEEDMTFDEVSGMADRLGLKGEARQAYVHDHMVQLGYDAVQSRESYVRKPEEPEEQQGSGSRWGFGGSGGSRQSQGRQGRGGRDSEDNF